MLFFDFFENLFIFRDKIGPENLQPNSGYLVTEADELSFDALKIELKCMVSAKPREIHSLYDWAGHLQSICSTVSCSDSKV